jgi:hypothetical protein
VLCKFKGIRSTLDVDQKRKGNSRDTAASLGAEIAREERAMTAFVYALYGLSAEETEMVEKR